MNALSGAESIEEYYQLSHDPFAARTPGFKFFTPQRKTVLAQLHHLARFGDQVLLVSGPEGSGKTLLRQVLVASSNKDTTQCVVTTAREFSGAAALLSFFCQAVNASGRDSRALLLRAGQLRETGVSLYLIVDDAHLLEQEALQELVDLSRVGGNDSPLRVFLFADESIQPMLDGVSADEEGAEWLHLIPLQPYTLDETRDYIAQRLEAAGQGIELLEEDQVNWIHRHSGGWPGRINDAARQSMREAMEEQAKPTATRRAALPVKSLVAVLLVAIGIGFAWFMGEGQEEPVTTVLELPEPVVPVNVTDDPELAELTELNSVPGVEAGVASSVPDREIEPLAPGGAADQAAPGVAAERPPTVNLFPSSDTEERAAPAAEIAAVPPRVETPVPAEPVQARPEVTAPTPAPIVTQPEPAAAPEVEQPAVAQAQQSSAQSSSVSTGADWYRAREPGRYVLQVLGSRSREAAQGFIAANPDVADLRFFQTTHQGKPWFVVTQGNYQNRQQAQQGIEGLPQAMRGASPWPRSIEEIQRALD